MTTRLPTFWQWLWHGLGDRPGFHRLLGWPAFAHLLVGILAAYAVSKPLHEVAAQALFPLIGIFVGLTFSWAGNAHALLQSKEVLKIARNRSGGIAEYVYTFQLCVLVVLLVITAWMFPLLGLEYFGSAFIEVDKFNLIAGVLLYSLISLAFRTSWQAVLGANMLLLSRVGMKGFDGD